MRPMHGIRRASGAVRGPRNITALLAAVSGLVASAPALGQSELVANPVILQWFEQSWGRMERRMPDFFMAGYGATWVAPISKASDPTSPGFDVFNRFDLGQPNVPGDQTRETIYGTEQGFRSIVDEFHRANGLVYVDSVMNHNSGRNGDAGFIAAGGYPQFYMGPAPGGRVNGSGDWGDFYNGGSQSHDPSGQAGPYNLWEGDLVSLIDINQASNNQFIRQPVSAGNPQNLPAGTIRNQPDAGNARYYPDLQLAPTVVANPGRVRSACCGFGGFNTAAENTTVYPYNLVSPMSGDPVAENATGLLTRWTQWMIEEFEIDGYRLDAAKHIQPWFWDRYWDTSVHLRRRAPDGSLVTPFSFGENVEGAQFVYNYYVRKDGFAFRDALDLSNAGDLRNIIGAKGTASIAGVNNNTLDVQDDGLNNGSVGVRHIHSHDNGSRGDGGSAPDSPFEDKLGYWAYAYMLLRPGNNIVYHNAREMHARFPQSRGGFWPREGVPHALGYGSIFRLNSWTVSPAQCSSGNPPGPSSNTFFTDVDDRLPRLVQLSNRYGRGWFVPLVSADGSVYIYQRRTPNGVSNLLVGVNDEYNACPTNFDERVVTTNFPQGLVMVELTGNAANATVDPSGSIPDTITVGVGGQVTIRVPRNTTRNGTTHTEHNRGYVVYGPATPQGTLTIVGASQTLPSDSTGISPFARRLANIDVVQSPTFQIELLTNRTGYPGGDVNFDDTAIFRINQGFVDYNSTGSFDVTTGEFRGYEGFVTQRTPIFGTALTTGTYRQTINTSQLPEGYNYISVLAFRQRTTGAEAGGMALFNDFRRVIYVDRVAPPMELVSSALDCATDTATLRVRNPDKTVTRVHMFVNEPVGTLTLQNQATPFDRQEWTFAAGNLVPGMNTLHIVALEEPSAGIAVNQSTTTVQFNVTFPLLGDVNLDAAVNINDLRALATLSGFQCEADMNGDGQVNSLDNALLRNILRTGEVTDATVQQP